ncbi:hypothetical protein [Photobacterium minamisatsumaniensis]|uniref:hypothetical protein n=1 Tax=Photobacterium minamisatsumaniensis TaxID=2910233 RepID=UPI003D0B229C
MSIALHELQETLCNVTSSVNLWTSSLNKAIVTSSNTVTLEEKTVLNSDLGGLAAFVGVWQGLEAPHSMKQIVGQTQLSGISKGQFANKTIETNQPGIDLFNGVYTIGLFMKANDVSTLVATAILNQSNPLNYQSTSVFVTNATTQNISVRYQVPENVSPSSRADWIYLFKGDQPIMNNSNYLKHVSVGPSSGGVHNISVADLVLSPGKYIVQYNPGHSLSTVGAAYSFTIE